MMNSEESSIVPVTIVASEQSDLKCPPIPEELRYDSDNKEEVYAWLLDKFYVTDVDAFRASFEEYWEKEEEAKKKAAASECQADIEPSS